MRSRSSSLGGGAHGAADDLESGGKAEVERGLIRQIFGLPKQGSHRVFLRPQQIVLRWLIFFATIPVVQF